MPSGIHACIPHSSPGGVKNVRVRQPGPDVRHEAVCLARPPVFAAQVVGPAASCGENFLVILTCGTFETFKTLSWTGFEGFCPYRRRTACCGKTSQLKSILSVVVLCFNR